jgi:diguanylate cyclase (GGDEF)-like protein
MEETLERELLRASRKGLPLGIIMFDVDDFKRFNDTFGHAAGDAILRDVGSLLLEHVRGEDIPCRYGGDEFIIVLSDAWREVTAERAKRLCKHVQHLHTQYEGQTLEAVSLSVGIAVFPEHGSTSAVLLKAVDEALYRAKRQGRGRIVVANSKCYH